MSFFSSNVISPMFVWTRIFVDIWDHSFVEVDVKNVIMLIAASISIITKILVKFSTLLLAALLFIFIITIHIPHLFTDADKTISIIALLKDISLMGGSLMISGISFIVCLSDKHKFLFADTSF